MLKNALKPQRGRESRSRPELVILIAGTGTSVGKTWVAVELARLLRADGMVVAARKPVQSFAVDDHIPDAVLLAEATGERDADVCAVTRSYSVPMAPPMAAEVLNRRPFTIADLYDELTWPPVAQVGLVESAGGVRSPLAIDGDTVSFAQLVAPDVVVLVADAELGAINAVRLGVSALEEHRVKVFLNRFDVTNDLHRRNAAWLRDHDDYDVVTSITALNADLSMGVQSLDRS